MMNRAKQIYDYYVRPVLGEKGQDMVEYALLLAIIVAIGWLIYDQSKLQESLKTIFSNAGTLAGKAAEGAKDPT